MTEGGFIGRRACKFQYRICLAGDCRARSQRQTIQTRAGDRSLAPLGRDSFGLSIEIELRQMQLFVRRSAAGGASSYLDERLVVALLKHSSIGSGIALPNRDNG
ncbi:MAG: hypothetical protein EOR30_31695 [Mesorhizobium sp.]|uniref:hypothetical protein n=1 Tax=Mesorhizobium sp. TaxID=1871066 RepID=UPI000FE73512|nr:hypothetical protein [Mesorhizobium sp.]RWI32375.1 MAG: hypothetical protein EOR14_34935 [Mesorhizobium sp.]RWI62250.1 MAG: hypothetical protein EOR17_34260 [Mesorhizobium sp.]RWI81180.1 MAG: hypothetical protein EOR20_34075 [Mesorhizobium sp.]RWJ42410.1 MAG: hypothetical protein EOR30_31695 [Mesorhizobium sp.]RWJ57218.1 MAG: hypothetical protein EOR32_31305 [Mesorhizobium sp.]